MDRVRDCNLYELIYGPSPTIDDSLPSYTYVPTITTFTPTITSTIPANNNQMLDDWGLDVIVNGFYPTNNTSLTSSVVATSTPITCAPTITNTSVMLLDNHQTLDDTICYDPHGVDNSFCSNTVPSYVVATTTQTSATVNNQNWDGWEQHFSSAVVGSSSSFVTATTITTTPYILSPTKDHYQHDSSSLEERLNLYQRMNENNGKQIMQIPNNPLNVSKTPLSSKNWPILTIPFLGKITETTTRKQQQNRLQDDIFRHTKTQHSLGISECTKINAQSQSKSNERKGEKRFYKMPMDALNNDAWSWRKYGEKSVDGSPYPRVYYKCNSTKECKAKRRVEQNRSNPDLITLKYSGRHNHPFPTFMNSSVCSATCSGIGTNDDKNTVNSKMSKDDYIFEELGNLVNFE